VCVSKSEDGITALCGFHSQLHRCILLLLDHADLVRAALLTPSVLCVFRWEIWGSRKTLKITST
jgi:hypothetical protein